MRGAPSMGQQCVAACCSVFQCAAVCCSVCCSVSHCVAVHIGGVFVWDYHVYIYVFMSLCIHIGRNMCMCVYTHVYMYVCAYILYIRTFFSTGIELGSVSMYTYCKRANVVCVRIANIMLHTSIRGVYVPQYRHTALYTRCSVLQCVAVCCSVLQCVAVRCSALQRVAAVYTRIKYTRYIYTAVCTYCTVCMIHIYCIHNTMYIYIQTHVMRT